MDTQPECIVVSVMMYLTCELIEITLHSPTLSMEKQYNMREL